MASALRSIFALLVLLIVSSAPATAQYSGPSVPAVDTTERAPSIGTIEGTVLGSDSRDALPTATVAVLSLPDSVLVTGTTADADGRFAIERLAPGRYFVRVSFVGYEPFASEPFTITPGNPRIELAAISLAPVAAMLEGVQVEAERAEVAFEIDRTVYNTRDHIAARGGNATDLLQNIPAIEVDVDGRVSLRGNQNVGILINGKPAPARGDFLTTFLQQIPADLVERVEVLPNPSAKFDPEGMAGMINIVLKQGSELGTSGGVILSAGTADERNASGSLNVQKGPWTVFSNYGFRSEDRSSNGYNFRENRYLDPLTFREQNSVGQRSSRSHVGSIAADYAIDPKSTWSVSGLVSRRDGSSDDLNRYVELGTPVDATGRYDRIAANSGSGTNVDLSTGFRRVTQPSERELTAELRFNRSVNGNFDRFTENLVSLDGNETTGLREQSRDDLDVRENEWNGQVDWIRPLAGLKLETGYKGTARSMQNDLLTERMDLATGVFSTDVTRTNAFAYDEQVHAAYALVSGRVAGLDVQAGLRAEQALTAFDLFTSGETFDGDYRSLFPSGVVAWKPAAARQVKLSYSKRVNRPRTSMLNPFTSYADPQNLFAGNPYLRPEYTHAFELGLQQFSRTGSLSITPYFRRTVDQMERFKTVNEDGTSLTTWRNYDRSDSYGAEVIGSLRVGRSLSGFASFDAYRIVTDASGIDDGLGSNAFSWSARANLTWTVREGLDVQAFYLYRAPRDVAQGRISSFTVANLSIRQKLMDDKASLTLRVSDPLDRMGFRFEIDSPTFYQLGERRWESRRATLSFSYNFGQAPKRSQRTDRERGDGGMGDVGIN